MKTGCFRESCVLALFSGIGIALSAEADVRLPSILGDHLVLQQQSQVELWGWAYAGETVEIETSWGEKALAVAAKNGVWKACVKTPKARPLSQGVHPEHIDFSVAKNENAVRIQDVLIGEVWLCSGQSNMTMMLGSDYPAGRNNWFGDKFLAKETGKTNRPGLRVFNVEKTALLEPKDDCKGVFPDHVMFPKAGEFPVPPVGCGWRACSPECAPYISAVAYYFGAAIQEKLDVPVGVVTSAVGGSNIQAWTALDALRKIPGLEKAEPAAHRIGNAGLYNGMIAPITPMEFRGVLWYQGESNAGASADEYAVLLKTMIADWRARFHSDELPFGIVQLANYGVPSEGAAGSKAAQIRAAQAAVARDVPHVGLAVAIDLGEFRIHPPDKRDVARRLVLWAKAKVYGESGTVFQSPVYRCQSVEGGAMRVWFETPVPLAIGTLDEAGCFRETPDAPLVRFEIAGEDGKFVRASARVDGDSVLVSAKEVQKPVAVRYAWADNPAGCNLYNKAGLPASPFWTGT